MAVDVAQFVAALDDVYSTFSMQEVQFDQKELGGLGERATMQYMERKFQQQLQRARAAFLQEFRNHSVVVESEVRKIREELTVKLEAKYGERIGQLKAEAAEAAALAQKHKDEVVYLKSLAGLQESYIAASRHRWGAELNGQLAAQVAALEEKLQAATQECGDLGHQLMCRDELVAQLNNELSGLERELKRQAAAFTEERRGCEEQLRGARREAALQQEQFQSQLKDYEERFEEYKAKTRTELEIQGILNARRAEALTNMEEERQLHVKARTKPTARIGPGCDAEAELEARCEQYALPSARYRVDDMGMDTAWRDYKLNDLQLGPTGKKSQPPKFRVERFKKAQQRASTGPNAPVATETPRPAVHICDFQLPPVTA